jgi:hypothetical protein
MALGGARCERPFAKPAHGYTLSDSVAPLRVAPHFRSAAASNVIDALARENGIADPRR